VPVLDATAGNIQIEISMKAFLDSSSEDCAQTLKPQKGYNFMCDLLDKGYSFPKDIKFLQNSANLEKVSILLGTPPASVTGNAVHIVVPPASSDADSGAIVNATPLPSSLVGEYLWFGKVKTQAGVPRVVHLNALKARKLGKGTTDLDTTVKRWSADCAGRLSCENEGCTQMDHGVDDGNNIRSNRFKLVVESNLPGTLRCCGCDTVFVQENSSVRSPSSTQTSSESSTRPVCPKCKSKTVKKEHVLVYKCMLW